MFSHWSWMSPSFPSSVWTVTRLMNENWFYSLFLNHLALYVILIVFSFFFGFFILWHAKTSILESVKLLKCESVHGRGLEFVAISVCFTSFCWYVSNCIFTHSCILSSVCYCYCFTILKQCQWRSAVVTCYIVSACPLMFTWTWS